MAMQKTCFPSIIDLKKVCAQSVSIGKSSSTRRRVIEQSWVLFSYSLIRNKYLPQELSAAETG